MQISAATAPLHLNTRVAVALVTVAAATAGLVGALSGSDPVVRASVSSPSAPVAEHRSADPLRAKSIAAAAPSAAVASRFSDPLIRKSAR